MCQNGGGKGCNSTVYHLGFLIFVSEFALILPKLSWVSTSIHPHEEDNLSVPNFLLVMLKLKKIVSQLQRALESMLGKLFILRMKRQKGREGWRVHTALRTAGSAASPAPRMLLS